MSHNTGGPAFPCLEPTFTGISSDGVERYDTEPHGGMTLRDYFAAKAMAAFIVATADDADNMPLGMAYKAVSIMSYDIADAMLSAREGGAA